MGFIYKITNKVNNKVYIGQTSRSLEIRWREHKSRAGCYYTSHLYSAMNKYGVDNFIFENAIKLIKKYKKQENLSLAFLLFNFSIKKHPCGCLIITSFRQLLQELSFRHHSNHKLGKLREIF